MGAHTAEKVTASHMARDAYLYVRQSSMRQVLENTESTTRAPHDRDGGHWIVFGALTRSVRDSDVMLDVLAGGEQGGFAQAAQTKPRALRIAVAHDFPTGTRGRLSDEVHTALDATADLLRSLGHTLIQRPVDMRARDVPVILGVMFRLIHDLVESVQRPQRLERRTRAFARPGALVSDPMKARPARRRAHVQAHRRAVRRARRATDPVTAEPAAPAGIMEGRGAIATYLCETGWVPFTILWNITGQPAASVPAGHTREGLPLAVQLVGRPDDEQTILSLAGQLEAERPWTERRPPVS